MKQKKIGCILLAMLMLLNLTACGGENTQGKNNGNKQAVQAEQQQEPEALPIAVSTEGEWVGVGGCYQLERLSENDYYIMKGNSEHLIYSNIDRLCSADGNILLDGYISDFDVTEDGIWYIREKGMVGGEYLDDCCAGKLGFDGQELIQFDVSERADSLAVVADDIYVYDYMNAVLAVYSTKGEKKGKVDISSAQLGEFSGRLFIGGDNSVWLMDTSQDIMKIYPVNRTEMNLGAAYELPEDMTALRKGTAEHVFLMATENELAYLDPTVGAIENILYWDECGIFDGELSSFIPDGDGFLCLSVTGLAKLVPANPEDIHPKTRLTLGTLSRYGGTDFVAMFNAFNDEYYVDIIDYSDGGKLSWEDAKLRLNTEMVSKQGPDMVMLYDIGTLRGSSAYADLYPLLDADPDMNRDDFYGLEAYGTGERLLIAPMSLYISTFGAKDKIAKGRTGWTWDEYFELKKELPEGGIMYSYLRSDFFLENSLNLYMPKAIDWETGTCSFDTPEFVRILQAAKDGYDPNCPEENPYFLNEVNAMMADGRMIMEESGFSDIASFIQNEEMFGHLGFIGWPTPDGSCGSVFYVSGISVCASTSCMDGCWEFAKYVLKSTYAYKPTFEKEIAEAIAGTTDEISGKEIKMTQEQADTYRMLMESITVAVSDTDELRDLIVNETAPMFTGDKSPEETAQIIQSIAGIYVAEHKGIK